MDLGVLPQSHPSQKVAEAFEAVGLASVPARIIFGFILGSGLSMALRPGFSFDDQGSRPFKALNMKDERGTWIPWYGLGLILAVLLGVFW